MVRVRVRVRTLTLTLITLNLITLTLTLTLTRCTTWFDSVEFATEVQPGPRRVAPRTT